MKLLIDSKDKVNWKVWKVQGRVIADYGKIYGLWSRKQTEGKCRTSELNHEKSPNTVGKWRSCDSWKTNEETIC